VGSDKESDRFATLAADSRKRAGEAYARSWQSYLAAIELEPQDARLACDAARVAVYRTKHDPVRAEELLRRAIRLAQEQSAVTGLSPSALSVLERTWGDALVHLGVFELESKHDPIAARQYFEQSLEVGLNPIPRPGVREVLLPRAIEASKQMRGTTAASNSSSTEN
jgi:tetratricopeptide (TPR) repeat protein